MKENRYNNYGSNAQYKSKPVSIHHFLVTDAKRKQLFNQFMNEYRSGKVPTVPSANIMQAKKKKSTSTDKKPNGV